MVALGLAALTLLCFLLRWPTFKVALDNNGASYLYNARFRTDEVDCTGLIGLVYLLSACYRFLGSRWGYRWVQVVMAVANALVVAPAYVLGTAVGGPVAGWAGAAFYAVFSNVPHLIPWSTGAERVCVPLSTGAYAALLASTGRSPGWVALSGLLAGACVLCKITSALEFLPLLAFPFCASAGAGEAILRFCLLMAGLVVFPGLEGFRLWKTGALRGAAGSLKHLRERYAAADRSVVEERAGIKEGSVALHWWLDLLSGTSPVWALAIAWMAHALAFDRSAPSILLVGWYAMALAVTAYRANWVPGHWVPQIPPLCVIAGLGFAGVILQGGAAGLPAFLAVLLVIAGSIRAWQTGRVHPWSAQKYVTSQGAIEQLGHQVKAVAPEQERVFSWGWHPQVYLYAERPSACPRILFCEAGYLDIASPDWRWELAQAFLAHRPACVLTLGPGLPLESICDLTGLRYELVREWSTQLQIALLRRTDNSQVQACSPSDLLAHTQKRAEEAIAAGDTPLAEVLLRALVDMKKGGPDVVAQLDTVMPGWQWVGRGVLPDLPGEILIEDAKDGSRTLGIGRGSEVRWLHSRYSPKAEAERLAGQIEPEAGVAYLVLGVGLGHPIVELARRMPVDAQIYGLERRRGLVRAAQDEHEVLRTGRVRLVGSASPPALTRLLNSLAGRRVSILVHPASHELDREYYDAVLTLLKERSQHASK